MERPGRNVQMSAYLVEQNSAAYHQLAGVSARYPDIEVNTYHDDFLKALPLILSDIPPAAFAFFFIDPKGWRFRLHDLAKMLQRPRSEVIFNLMFDFINRAASMKEPAIEQGVDELIPYGDWRRKLEEAEQGGATSEDRKAIIVDAFRQASRKLALITTSLRRLFFGLSATQALYCLCYATRHPKGIEVFRDCQLKALQEQAKTRATTKVKHAEATTGQREIFELLHDMAPNDLEAKLAAAKVAAEEALLELTPAVPGATRYEHVWPRVLSKHLVRLPDLNQIAARLRKEQRIIFPDWETGKRVPQPSTKCTNRSSCHVTVRARLSAVPSQAGRPGPQTPRQRFAPFAGHDEGEAIARCGGHASLREALPALRLCMVPSRKPTRIPARS